MPTNPRSWFNDFYKKLALPLTKFVMKRIGADKDEVDEIVEETFVAAWRGLQTFRHKSSYFTWLCRIALNKIADYYHDQVNSRSGIIVPLIDAITQKDEKSLSPEEGLALKDLRKSVNDCLNLLPYEKRRLLWFRYWANLSYSEISKIMGISERAVEGQLYRVKHEFSHLWTKTSRERP
jgi:RNA polymerase sigma-70 factor (ECF subfamily)